jgi:hypothetical protein
MRGNRVPVVVMIACLASAVWAQPQVRPIKRPPNNQLAIEGPDTPSGRIELPPAVTGVTSQLVFHVSPLSSKGLLSQQVEDAIKALDKANGNATFLKLRAFVAGNGDLRRVQAIVTEVFTARKWPLPALTTIQVGSLLKDGVQVVIESISEEKRPVNTSGLAFVPAVDAASGAEAVANIAKSIGNSTLLRLTCFADSLAEAEAARDAAARQLSKVAGVFVQSTRYTLGSRVACQAVAANGPVKSARVILTGAQITFGEGDAELQQAFDRMEKAVLSMNAHSSKAAQINVYSTSKALADKGKALTSVPSTALFVEGLSAPDATLAVEAVIPVP